MGQFLATELTDGPCTTQLEYEKRLSTPGRIRQAIACLPRNNPTKCEGEIRRLNEYILTVKGAIKRYQLLNELKAVAGRGLSKELRDLMNTEGLTFQALGLVVHYMTNLPQLAKNLYTNAEDFTHDPDLELIKRRLGPQLEVLGALKATGIDTTQQWARELCKRSPSFVSLSRLSLAALKICCYGACAEDKDVVQQIADDAESCSRQLFSVQKDRRLAEQNSNMKANHERKLKKAKESLQQAKLESPKTKEFKAYLKTTMDSLELPYEFLEQEKISPDHVLETLSELIYQGKHLLESTETYDSDLEVVARASGGRALCGIYYSQYEPLRTAGRQIILLPTEVVAFSPIKSREVQIFHFSEKRAAANFVEMIASSSICFGLGETRLLGRLATQGQDSAISVRSTKTLPTRASVLQCTWVGKKAFQIEQGKMVVPMTARKRAMSIVKDRNSDQESKEAARSFLQHYGSHFPSGVHTFGGLFFTVTEAASKSKVEAQSSAEEAVRELEIQNSAGYHGGLVEVVAGVNIKNRRHSIARAASITRKEKTTVKHVFRSMGPQTTDFATFNKRLSYNSTWAVIDRGSPEGYIPVWELLASCNEDLTEPARVLKETWYEDEKSREDAARREGQMKLAMEELYRTKVHHLKKKQNKKERYRVTNAEQIRVQSLKERGEAYDRGIEFIMEDPQHNICGITRCKQNHEKRYKLTCWKATHDTPVSVEAQRRSHGGWYVHVFFYSELLFQWKEQLSI